MCHQATEDCVPIQTQECWGLRWEGAHKKISQSFFIMAINFIFYFILFGAFYFFCGVHLYISGGGGVRKAVGVG